MLLRKSIINKLYELILLLRMSLKKGSTFFSSIGSIPPSLWLLCLPKVWGFHSFIKNHHHSKQIGHNLLVLLVWLSTSPLLGGVLHQKGTLSILPKIINNSKFSYSSELWWSKWWKISRRISTKPSIKFPQSTTLFYLELLIIL